MNQVTEKFLEEMKVKIDEDVKESMKSQVADRLAKNLQTLVKESIISQDDADAFGSKYGIHTTAKIKRKVPTMADDVCGRSISGRGSSC